MLIDQDGSRQIWANLDRSQQIFLNLAFWYFYIFTFGVINIWHCWHLTNDIWPYQWLQYLYFAIKLSLLQWKGPSPKIYVISKGVPPIMPAKCLTMARTCWAFVAANSRQSLTTTTVGCRPRVRWGRMLGCAMSQLVVIRGVPLNLASTLTSTSCKKKLDQAHLACRTQ